jgi:hypothetical protein
MAQSRRVLGGTLLFACAGLAWAAHPFVTDDTATQGRGNFELQLGAQFTRTSNDVSTLSAFQFAPQLSYGVDDTVDVQLRPNYNVDFNNGADPQRASGFGDIFVGLKWRFFEQGEWTGAATIGTGLPVGNGNRGLDAGQSTPYAYLIAMRSTETLQIQASIGAIRNAAISDGRAWLAHFSTAVLWTPRPKWQLGLDIVADQNPLKSNAQWPVATLAGFIYSVTRSVDLDAGYQRGLNRSAPDNQYLVGATIRW